MRWTAPLLLAAVISWSAIAAAAESVYAASVRSQVGDASSVIAGNLYTVDLATGVFALVGAIRVGGEAPIGVTGLADHPATGVLYGITAGSSPNYPGSLVKIDVAKAEATLVGSLGAPGSDIAFNPSGTLFVWLRSTSQLATVDLASGAAIPLGPAGPPSETGGIAIDSAGRAYLAATGATGSLDVIDTTTGAITKGPRLHGAPYPAGINSLAVSPTGVLYAVNTNLGSPANTALVKIDVTTGAIVQVGPLPNDTDALVFARRPGGAAESLASRNALMVLAAAVVAALALAFVIRSRAARSRVR